MKLVLKQRLFSWFDSYDVCDEYGNAVFSVKGRLAWGHLLEIYDNMGNKVGVLKEKVIQAVNERRYGENICVARWRAPVNGEDGKIE